jgi:hypothetical protein
MAQEAGMQAQANGVRPEEERSRPVDEAAGMPAVESRALVPTQPSSLIPHYGRTRYPVASFLAQLIAIDRRLPQTRTRARVAAADAAAVYSAVLTEKPVRPGCTLRRSA